MEEILPRLYVGDDEAYEKVKDADGWAFLRACKYGPGGHQETLGYKTLGAPKDDNYLWVKRGNKLALNILDLDDPNFIAPGMVDTALEFIDRNRNAGKKVLVACNHGTSRSPSIVLLYMRSIGELPYSFGMSLRVFRTLYPSYDPGQGIRQYLRIHWGDWRETYGRLERFS